MSVLYGGILAGFGASAQSDVPPNSPAAGPDEIRGSDSRSILPNYGPAFITLAPAALLTLPWLLSSIDTSSTEYAPPQTSALNEWVPCPLDAKKVTMTVLTGLDANLNSSASTTVQNNQLSLNGKKTLGNLFSLSPTSVNKKWKSSPWLVAYLHGTKPIKPSGNSYNRRTRGQKLPWVKIGFASASSCVSPQSDSSQRFCVNWSDYPSTKAMIKKYRAQYWKDYLLKNWASHYTSVSSYMAENVEDSAQNLRVLQEIYSVLSGNEKIIEDKNIGLATMTLDAISYIALRSPKTRLSALEKYVVTRARKVAEEPKSQYFMKTEDLYRDRLLKKRSYVKYYAYFQNIDKDADKYRKPAINQLRSSYRSESSRTRLNKKRVQELVNQIILIAGKDSKEARTFQKEHANLSQRRAEARRQKEKRRRLKQAKQLKALQCMNGYRARNCAGLFRYELNACKKRSVLQCCAKYGMRRTADFFGCE